jgi:ribose 1,5-bisphosphokinase PhnN
VFHVKIFLFAPSGAGEDSLIDARGSLLDGEGGVRRYQLGMVLAIMRDPHDGGRCVFIGRVDT